MKQLPADVRRSGSRTSTSLGGLQKRRRRRGFIAEGLQCFLRCQQNHFYLVVMCNNLVARHARISISQSVDQFVFFIKQINHIQSVSKRFTKSLQSSMKPQQQEKLPSRKKPGVDTPPEGGANCSDRLWRKNIQKTLRQKRDRSGQSDAVRSSKYLQSPHCIDIDLKMHIKNN